MYLPNTLVARETIITKTDDIPTKAALKLPEDKFVFLGFHAEYRICELTAKAWCEILSKTPNSVLWLRNCNEKFKVNFIEYFKNNAIDPNRIIFDTNKSLTQKWQHYHANLALDSLSFSSCTALFILLASGIPLLTLDGKLPQNKVASSYLTAANLEELIQTTYEGYVNAAVNYYNNQEDIISIKNKISETISKTSLFEPRLYVKNIEKAYSKILEHSRSNSKDKFIIV